MDSKKENQNEIATLYLVATPIGNLADMTFRAVNILKSVDLILCEDVSNAQKVLKHYEINTKCTNYFANSKLSKTFEIVSLLKEGKNLALISDAGMPTISDPGSLLVQKIYEAVDSGDLEAEIKIVPGATALTSAFALSSFSGNQFTFYGFLPQKKGRETLFKEIAESERVSIFYESVHRIEKCLESLEKFLEEDRKIVIARELTKLHEETVRGNAKKVKEYFQNHKDKVRGEFVVVIDKKD